MLGIVSEAGGYTREERQPQKMKQRPQKSTVLPRAPDLPVSVHSAFPEGFPVKG